MLIDYIRREVRPKELRMVPDELLSDGAVEFLERTLILNWVRQWLKCLQWYHTVAMKSDVTLEELLDFPVVEISWRRKSTGSDVRRYGVFWKCIDIVTSRGLAYPPGILTDTPVSHPGWILGGYSGRDFGPPRRDFCGW